MSNRGELQYYHRLRYDIFVLNLQYLLFDLTTSHEVHPAVLIGETYIVRSGHAGPSSRP